MTEKNKDKNLELVLELFREAQEQARKEWRGPRPYEPPTIHYTDLPAAGSKEGAEDWETYRREIGRLLAEGKEGKCILIHAGEIIGIWDTKEEAGRVASSRFLMHRVLIKQLLTREPVIRHPLYFRQARGEVSLDRNSA